MNYGYSKTVDLTFEPAVQKVTETLRTEGFGVLTTIDVKDTLKKRLNIDFKKYVILGACNPSFAHQSLQLEENIGLLLPCNVIVYEKDGSTVIAAFNPMVMTQLIDNPAIGAIAEQVKQRLERAVSAV